MIKREKLPSREHVFMQSLQYHGFRKTLRRKNLKFKKGYVIPSTEKEDSGGIDFWVKLPRSSQLIPVQVTMRGVRFFRRFHNPSQPNLKHFILKSDERIAYKRWWCYYHGIAFVLVRDFIGRHTNQRLARADVKALRVAVALLLRQS